MIRKGSVILLSFIILLNLFCNNVYAGAGGGTTPTKRIELSTDGKTFIIHATAHYADTGIKYKTLGWKFQFIIDGKSYYGILAQPDNQTGSGTQPIDFTIPFDNVGQIADTSSVMGILRTKNAGDQVTIDKLNNYASKGGDITFNAIVCVTINGVPQGQLKADGSHTGTIYETANGIIAAQNWSIETKNALSTYFDISYKFNPQPIKTIAAITGNFTYEYGQSISITGSTSWFPDSADAKYYTWEYKPSSESSWVTLHSPGLSKIVPSFPALNPGKYNVKLTCYYTSTKYKQATGEEVPRNIVESYDIKDITVNPPATDDAYVIASGVTEKDKVISQADIDANKNISVMVTGAGELKNYESAAGLSKWVVNIKKSPTGEQSQTDTKTSSLILTSAYSTNFTIPAGVLKSVNSYTQKFEINATATVQGKDISSSPAYCEIKLIKEQVQKPPIAIISSKDTIMAGEPVNISGTNSYAQSGSITWYDWTLNGASSNITGVSGTVAYPNEGTFTQSLTVVDSNSLTGSTSKDITVTPPKPHAVIEVSGKLKVDRVVTLDSSKSTSPQMYPIDTTKTKWSIVPVTGGSDIFHVASISSDNRPVGDPYTSTICNGEVTPKTLYKTPGTYDVTLTVTNTKGYSDTATQRITIAPDLPPVAAYIVGKTFIRDQVDVSGKHYAIMELTDQSYSPDGDEIGKRIWRYRYDSDNDGDYTDETWVLIDDTNLTSVSIKAYDVGRYRFNLQVQEKYEP